jgi:hypothetical protein
MFSLYLVSISILINLYQSLNYFNNNKTHYDKNVLIVYNNIIVYLF